VWQWLHQPRTWLSDGRKITTELYRTLLSEEMEKIKSMVGDKRFASGKYELARRLFDKLVTEKNFAEFLTLSAYRQLD
jgi:malate synthase